ncbi:MAG: hypothetical protein LUE25_05070 [Clostridiales bacterium]|nr:hypothetical protein [Clostridiales bacterium]
MKNHVKNHMKYALTALAVFCIFSLVFFASCSDDGGDEETTGTDTEEVTVDETTAEPTAEPTAGTAGETDTESETEEVTDGETEEVTETTEAPETTTAAPETTTSPETTAAPETTTAAPETTTASAETTTASAETTIDITGLWVCHETVGRIMDIAGIDSVGTTGLISLEFDEDTEIDGYVRFDADGGAEYYIPKTQYDELMSQAEETLKSYFERMSTILGMTLDDFLSERYGMTWDDVLAMMISDDAETTTIAGIEAVLIYEGEYTLDGDSLTLYISDEGVTLDIEISDDGKSMILSDGEYSIEMTKI